MTEFTPITTQEDFDAAIGERLKRERKTIADKYADYQTIKDANAGYDQQLADLQALLDTANAKVTQSSASIADLSSKIATYETDLVKMRVAQEQGLPFEIASRLTGKDEAEIRADAQALAQFFAKPPSPDPLKSLEPSGLDAKDSALRAFTFMLTEKGD